MKEKNTNTITDLSDADFLFFLYSERDRENSLRQYQGWSLWALIGSIITIVCVIYALLKAHLNDICIVQFLYCTSALMALLLCAGPFFTFLKKERGFDNKKLKTISRVSPNNYLFIAVVVSSVLAINIPLEDNINPWSITSIGWLAAFVLFVVGKIVCRINKDKIVQTYMIERVFANIKWDKIYFFVVCYVLILIFFNSIKRLSLPMIGNPDYELSVCVAAFVLLLFFLVEAIKSEKNSNKIDILIDDFVYKEATKESIFRMMRIGRMGNTVVESCINEIIGIGTSLEEIEQTKKNFEDVAHQYEIDDVDVAKIPENVKIMNDALALLVKLTRNISDIIDKLEQVMIQVPSLGNDSDYQKVSSMTRFAQEKTAELIDSVKASLSKIMCWVEMNRCEKYGCICREGCEHRHDNIAFRTKIRNRITHTKTKPRKCYK